MPDQQRRRTRAARRGPAREGIAVRRLLLRRRAFRVHVHADRHRQTQRHRSTGMARRRHCDKTRESATLNTRPVFQWPACHRPSEESNLGFVALAAIKRWRPFVFETQITASNLAIGADGAQKSFPKAPVCAITFRIWSCRN